MISTMWRSRSQFIQVGWTFCTKLGCNSYCVTISAQFAMDEMSFPLHPLYRTKLNMGIPSRSVFRLTGLLRLQLEVQLVAPCHSRKAQSAPLLPRKPMSLRSGDPMMKLWKVSEFIVWGAQPATFLCDGLRTTLYCLMLCANSRFPCEPLLGCTIWQPQRKINMLLKRVSSCSILMTCLLAHLGN